LLCDNADVSSRRRVFNLLMVEDDPAVAYLFRYACRENRIPGRLHQVPNASQALEYLYRRGEHVKARRPDLIIIDLNLPGMDGIELLTTLKSDPDLRCIPVIVLSASESPRDIRRAYDNGASCFITKPVSLPEFERCLTKSVEFWLRQATLVPRTVTRSLSAGVSGGTNPSCS
jgi:chemotaxis family two-component system response regulator Rcp1